MEKLIDAIRAVRAIHAPSRGIAGTFCSHCKTGLIEDGHRMKERYPCPTIQAVNEALDGGHVEIKIVDATIYKHKVDHGGPFIDHTTPCGLPQDGVSEWSTSWSETTCPGCIATFAKPVATTFSESRCFQQVSPTDRTRCSYFLINGICVRHGLQ